ncbi:HAD family phosphatase [Tessaracoccus sp. MC1865]|uniref:HAD family hydrolase n=1 Tax=Tessaracoccus sp. MC1865 TaxID=2760310 RepID=UPI0016018903|nr:HAD family phosphatase [Tessaracoccus sp. MC1865]QTO36364.1 HAD family phosphatase [Tessaracoccus sp. MC1865]
MQAEPKAVLWDFDGTLVNTEPVWQEIERQMLAEHGVTFTTEQWESMTGQDARLSAAMIAEAIGSDDIDGLLETLLQRVADHLRQRDLPYLPGSRELLVELAALGVPCAIVTASSGSVLDAARDRLPQHVSFIVTSDDVKKTKPHPEGYLLAMERLGVSPKDVVILEDSVPGTLSGLASGAVVYAVPSVPLEQHRRMHIGEGLDGITWETLVDVWRARKELA